MIRVSPVEGSIAFFEVLGLHEIRRRRLSQPSYYPGFHIVDG
jgi:hypothetical protein